MTYINRPLSLHVERHAHIIAWLDAQPPSTSSAAIREAIEFYMAHHQQSGPPAPQSGELPDYGQLLADIRDTVEAALSNSGLVAGPGQAEASDDHDQLQEFGDMLL